MSQQANTWEPAVPEPAPRASTKPTCEICGSELKRDRDLDTPTCLGYRCSRCRMTSRRARPVAVPPKEPKT